MDKKLDITYNRTYVDNEGTKVTLVAIHRNDDEKITYRDETGLFWDEYGNLIHPGELPDRRLLTEVLENGDEALIGYLVETTEEKPKGFLLFDNSRNYLTSTDIIQLAEYVNKIEMIANRVGLEVQVSLCPLREAP